MCLAGISSTDTSNSSKNIPLHPKTTIKMFSKAAVIVATLASAAHAIPAGPIAPGYGHPAPAPHYDETPKPYAFEYGVEDSYSGAAFGQTETSDTSAVAGNYRVALPDGRTQIVNYHADPVGYGGYVADVKYEGVAHPGPAYKPAPHPKVVPHPAVVPVVPIHG